MVKNLVYTKLYILDVYYILPVGGNVYDISRDDCNKRYVGQTKPKVKTRLKGHQAQFKNNHKEKSATAKHWIESGHYFSEVNVLQEI